MPAASKTRHFQWKGTGAEKGRTHQIAVQDQRTERSSVATAISDSRGPGEQWTARTAEVTIETMWWGSGHESAPTPESPAFVTIRCHTGGFNRGITPNREVTIANEELELGDLPLIVLALQDAIRVGVERGSLPDLSGREVSR